jgi:hypothetical protein
VATPAQKTRMIQFVPNLSPFRLRVCHLWFPLEAASPGPWHSSPLSQDLLWNHRWWFGTTGGMRRARNTMGLQSKDNWSSVMKRRLAFVFTLSDTSLLDVVGDWSG